VTSIADELRAGHEALARASWDEARACFERAIAREPAPDGYEGLASARSMLADGNGAIAARERAYGLYQERGDLVSAARQAMWLAVDTLDFRYEAAVASGWLQRAGRLLEGVPPCVERGMVRMLEGHMALMANNDIDTALARAAEGATIARQTGSVEVEVLSLGLEGLARVSEGDVRRGMKLLDESTVAALGGEVKNPVAVGQSCCYLIHACERVRDFERAGQWCLRVREFCERWHYTTMFTVCRTQYASVLMYRGDWAEAEAELLAALDELRAHRPAAAPPAIVRLGELRRRQGRRDEAAELFESVRTHRMAMLGRGELALDQGDARAASDLAEQALRHIPRESRTERVAALDLEARAAAALGDDVRAGTAATELEAIADVVGTEPLRAIARLARGVALARRDRAGARRALEDAADLLERSAMPFEAAHARVALARVLAADGRAEAARAESHRAERLFRQLGVRDPGEGTGQAHPGPGRDAATPLTPRELEVLGLIAAGLADKEMADRLGLSPHTVHRHVSNILTKLDVPSRAAAAAHAARLGLLR
jgi:DNA-binding NarL/FixJ family response regulator